MIEIVVVLIGLLGSTVALCLLLAGSRSVEDASTNEQAFVFRRARRVLVPLVIASVIGAMTAFGLISSATDIKVESGEGFALFFAVMTAAVVPLFVVAAIFGRRYRAAGTAPR